MAKPSRLRRTFVDAPDSLGERARVRRWNTFGRAFPSVDSMSLLDLGGTVEYWRRAPIRPRHVHVVNLDPSESSEILPDWIHFHLGDVCDLPSDVTRRTYDLVYSNSVIEHLGGHVPRRHFAESVSALAPRYWIQTPYRYFPVEPHWVCPGLQYLPLRLRASVGLRWPLVHGHPASFADSLEAQMRVELLSIAQMRAYFPEARMEYERILGLVKSIIAVRDSS